jgi:chromosome segregation ATPase
MSTNPALDTRVLEKALNEAVAVVEAIETVVPELGKLREKIQEHSQLQQRAITDASGSFSENRRRLNETSEGITKELTNLRDVAYNFRTGAQRLLDDLKSEFTRLGNEQKTRAAADFELEIRNATVDAVETMRQLPASLTTELHQAAEDLRESITKTKVELTTVATETWAASKREFEDAQRDHLERAEASKEALQDGAQQLREHVASLDSRLQQLNVVAARLVSLTNSLAESHSAIAGPLQRIDSIDAQLVQLRTALGLEPAEPSTLLIIRQPNWLRRLLSWLRARRQPTP